MIDYGYCQSEACWGDQYMTGDRVQRVMQGIKAVGGSRVRIGVQVGTWADLDRAINSATSNGLIPLLCVLGNETLQAGSQTNVTAFAALCKAVALRYGPAGTNQVSELEIFNEMNASLNPPNNNSPALYVQFLKAAYEAIKSVATSMTVISGGTIPSPTFDFFVSSKNPVDWYTGVYAAGGKAYMDQVGFHWYFEQYPTTTDVHWTYLDSVRAIMVANGDGAKKIRITEVGVGYPGGPGVTTASQARDFLKVLIDSIISRSYCGAFYVYQYANSYADPNNTPYGIVDYNFVPKSPIFEYAGSIRGTGTADVTRPSAPTGLVVSDITENGAAVRWNPSTDDVGVTDYYVYLDGGVKLTDSLTTNANLAGLLTPGTPYRIYITALDAAGNESLPSALSATFTTNAPSGAQAFDEGRFVGSTLPTSFTQLGLGFTVSGGVALPNPPTSDSAVYTVAPFTVDKQTADHRMRVTLAGTSAASDRSAMAVVRMRPDGTEWVAALTTGGNNDSLKIITCIAGKIRTRAAKNATPGSTGQFLEIIASGNIYTANLIDTASTIRATVDWPDTNGVFPGARNRRTGMGWHHKRVHSANFVPPGISGWKGSDLNAVQPATGGVEPWMYAIVDQDDWAELTATGSWETLISNRKLVPAAPGPSVPPTPSTFVTRDSSTGNLMLGGQRYRFGGANAPFMGIIGSAPAAVAGETVLPGDGYHYASHAQIDATLAAAQAFNSNVLTSWGAVQSVGTSSSVQPTLGVFNAAALEATDYCLQQCNLLGIKIIANFSGNYTYETEGSKFWYCTANGFTPDAYATQFFTNATIINSFKAHITFCLNHVNVYTGIAYKDDPAILAWGTGGELGTYPAVPEWPYYAWTDTISQHIKVTCGAQQLVADGHCAIRTDGQDGTLDVNSLTLPYVDMYQLHPYSHFTPPRYSTQEGKICHQYGKAYFIGEFPWQGTEPDMSTPTIWSPTELMSVAKGSTYVDGIQMWELLAPNVTFGGGYTLHWPTPDNSSGHGIPLETARGRQMAANNLAIASGKVWPTRLVAVRTAGVQYNSAAYRGGGFNAEGITLYIPEENDVVLVFGGSQGVNTVANAPSGWVNPLGANVGVSTASHTLACMYHVVTAAEAAAVNVSYVISNMFGSTANGDGAITVIRGADPANVIDAFATASGTASTTHVLPALTGGSLQDDSMVLSCVASFANNAYTVPSGTGEAGMSNGHQGIWLGLYDDFTTAGVNVAAKNITAVNSDVYASITLAITGL